ncbi:LysR family transcriptional regulator [Shewanella sp. WXL01]|uniref:LysR family transcriptional regulator n=1 Tax=Shewanella sp. WXL01 TaxID=2709721 RepID=UPI0014386789|nr:LysR family transcriptional regulator [Shewanella sp. WXL01]NKF49241.1 LysR family transcriptional regulator [Shewanella sp. WXL01]
MILTTERLQYLVEVANKGSFSAAADALGVSVAAVNKSIQHLEFDLEITLFERHSGKKPTLTNEGKRLYFQALDVLPKLIAMEHDAQMLSEGVESKLTICVHCYSFYPAYAEAFSELLQRYPHIELNIIEGEELQSYDDDFDILIAPTRLVTPRGLNLENLDTINWKLVCAPHFALAKLHGEIELNDLEQYRQIMLPQGFFTSKDYQEAMRYSSNTIAVDRFYQFNQLLFQGVGFALYPEALAKQAISDNKLVELDFDFGNKDVTWPIDLIWRKSLGVAGQWLIERLRQAAG